ncbi:hypothetical protein ABEF95_002130, partial [Exophiala dermatitidis]
PTGPKKERSRSNSRRQRRDSTHNHANGTPKGPAAQSKQPRNGAPTNINTTTAPTPAASQAQAPPELEVTSPVTPGGSSQDKKVRGLLKKIRAIEDLKMRFAGGEKLEDTQMRKISTEDAVRKELAGLGYNG